MGAGACYAEGMGSFTRKAVGAFAAASLAGCQQAPPPPKPVPATYSLNRCGGVPSQWKPPGTEYGELNSYNFLRVGPAGLEWVGQKVSEQTLHQYLKVMPSLFATVLVAVFEPGTSCDTVIRIRKAFDDLAQCGKETTCVEESVAENRKVSPPPCDADCQAYGRAGGSDKGMGAAQKARLKANYLDKYGMIPW